MQILVVRRLQLPMPIHQCKHFTWLDIQLFDDLETKTIYIGKGVLAMMIGALNERHSHVAATSLRDYICIVSSTSPREEHQLTRSLGNISQLVYILPRTGQILFSDQVVSQKGTSGGASLCLVLVETVVAFKRRCGGAGICQLLGVWSFPSYLEVSSPIPTRAFGYRFNACYICHAYALILNQLFFSVSTIPTMYHSPSSRP